MTSDAARSVREVPTGSDPSFDSAVPPPASFAELERGSTLTERVSQQLMEAIVDGGISPGDKLPSERDLAEQFGVSRTVIREAVRTLAAKGIVEVRTGSGLRVSSVPASAVAEMFRLHLHGLGMLGVNVGQAYAKIHDVRQLMEIHVAELASEQSTEEDAGTLRHTHEQMRLVLHDVDQASEADVAFHRAIAEATHNELFVVMLDSIGGVLLDIRRRTLGEPGRPERAFAAHQHILDAILARDAAAARTAMQSHLEDSKAVWEIDA